METEYCEECKEEHEKIAFCTECGACLYRHSKQAIELVMETGLPFHECLICKKINFWD